MDGWFGQSVCRVYLVVFGGDDAGREGEAVVGIPVVGEPDVRAP